MRTTRISAALILSIHCALGAPACVQKTDASPETPQETSTTEGTASAADALGELGDLDPEASTTEALQRLGYESPSPGPGVPLPGGHDPGGPGHGWGRGWVDDPQYAPFFAPHDPDPYKEQRHAKQREYDRIGEENRRHAAGGKKKKEPKPRENRRYPGGVQKAPDAPRTSEGPLNDRGRCEAACWAVLLVDNARCRRLPDYQRRACWAQANENYALCIRDCVRQYPR